MSYVPLSQKLNVPALTLDRGERLSKANTPILLHGPVNLGHSKLLEFSYKFGLDRSIYPLVLWIEVIAFLYMAGLGQEKKLTIPDSLSIQGHMV